MHWERIEPVAESFGDLDPLIDGREGDQEPGQDFTGFHRIEKALWEAGNVSRHGALRRPAARRRAEDRRARRRGDARRRCSSPTAPRRCSTRSPPARSPARRSGTRTPTCGTSPATSRARRPAIDALRPYLQDDRPRPARRDRRAVRRDRGGARRVPRRATAGCFYDQLDHGPAARPQRRITALTESVSRVAAVVAGR